MKEVYDFIEKYGFQIMTDALLIGIINKFGEW